MDDISVFRRYFVASNLLSEILSGLMGSVTNSIMGGGQAPMSATEQTANFGQNPFIDTTYKEPSSQSESNTNQNSSNTNDNYQFPSG